MHTVILITIKNNNRSHCVTTRHKRFISVADSSNIIDVPTIALLKFKNPLELHKTVSYMTI